MIVEQQKNLPPHKIVGVVKFVISREDFFNLVIKLAGDITKLKEKFDFDQIIVVGTVNKVIINEIRFIKYE